MLTLSNIYVKCDLEDQDQIIKKCDLEDQDRAHLWAYIKFEIGLQENDLFAPGHRKGGDMFKVDPYMVTVNHVSDFSAYKVLNIQVHSVQNDEVRTIC